MVKFGLIKIVIVLTEREYVYVGLRRYGVDLFLLSVVFYGAAGFDFLGHGGLEQYYCYFKYSKTG